MELQLQQSYAPAFTLATFVEQYPDWPLLSKKFNTIASTLFSHVRELDGCCMLHMMRSNMASMCVLACVHNMTQPCNLIVK